MLRPHYGAQYIAQLQLQQLARRTPDFYLSPTAGHGVAKHEYLQPLPRLPRQHGRGLGAFSISSGHRQMEY